MLKTIREVVTEIEYLENKKSEIEDRIGVLEQSLFYDLRFDIDGEVMTGRDVVDNLERFEFYLSDIETLLSEFNESVQESPNNEYSLNERYSEKGYYPSILPVLLAGASEGDSADSAIQWNNGKLTNSFLLEAALCFKKRCEENIEKYEKLMDIPLEISGNRTIKQL